MRLQRGLKCRIMDVQAFYIYGHASRRLNRAKYLRSKSPDRGCAPLLSVLHYEYFTVRLFSAYYERAVTSSL